MARLSFFLLALLALAGCGGERPLTVGSKNFGENEILGEMFAALAEAAGIPVVRRVDLGDTQLNLEALKRGEIDVYPEYNGTGLVLLGQPPITDGDAAMERLRALYEPLGLIWGKRLGFDNSYGLVMRADRAQELGVARISDLAARAPELRIGIEEDFEERPLDGYDAMLARYGLTFGAQTVVPAAERPRLYDLLLDGEADVIEGFTTDGQIAEYGLVVLEDDLSFFPVYEVAPLMRADARARLPGLGPALDRLAGKLDAALMRRLNLRVDIDGQPAREVAQAALIELGLLEGMTSGTEGEPLRLAAPALLSNEERALALRAARRAFAGRQVALVTTADPLGAVGAGAARLALVNAAGFFEADAQGDPVLRPGFQAVGLVGDAAVHLVTTAGGPAALADVRRLATGPEGSASHLVGRFLIDGLDLGATLVPSGDGGAAALRGALATGAADAALALAAPNPGLAQEIGGDGGRILSLDGWASGANLLRYPFLRRIRLAEGIETLGSQLVLAGPGVVPAPAIGDQGPGAVFTARAQPLAAETVTTLVEALGTRVAVDPLLPQAEALAPAIPPPPAAISPAPDVSVLDAAIVVMLIWMLWLYARPEPRRTAQKETLR